MKRILTACFLALLIAAVGVTYVGCHRGSAQGKLQIMYSGNLRGSVAPCGCHIPKGGIARWVAFMNRYKNSNAHWLTVDAGNSVDRNGSSGCSDKCQFLLKSYRELHYDVLNIGKQEVMMGYDALAALRDTMKGTELISANLMDLKSNRPFFKPSVVKDFGKFRVGLLGLLNEQDFLGSDAVDSVKLKVIPALDAAEEVAPRLSQKTDAIILLCDLTSAQIDTLLKTLPQIDLVISSGALKSGETPTTTGKSHVVGTGSLGYNGHFVMLNFNPLKPDSIGFEQYQDALTESYDMPGVWTDRVATYKGKSTSVAANPSMIGAGSTSVDNFPAKTARTSAAK